MKKYLFLMLALAGIMFSFVSCSSDDDDLTSLQSTIWVSPDDGDGLRTLTFGEKDFYVTISKIEVTISGTHLSLDSHTRTGKQRSLKQQLERLKATN